MDGDTRRADLVPQASGGGSESPPPERLPHSADPDIEPAFQDDEEVYIADPSEGGSQEQEIKEKV